MPTTTIARGVRTVRDVACWWCRAVLKPRSSRSHVATAKPGLRRLVNTGTSTASSSCTSHQQRCANLTPKMLRCGVRFAGGELVCCDGCTNAYHLPCLEHAFPQCMPGDDDDAPWSCPRCTGTAPAAQPISSDASTVCWEQQPHTPPQVTHAQLSLQGQYSHRAGGHELRQALSTRPR